MRAIAYRTQGPAENLIDIELDKPKPKARELLVEVKAVSVNPVDTKMRANLAPDASGLRVLGYDASGIVREVGPDAKLFKVGDEVWYAGSNIRPGTNEEFHLIDERIVGLKPRTLSHADAAAMPLTSLTAWEMLFDRLDVAKPVAGAPRAILIIGGAGGVGSMAIQLAKQVAGLTVIATASRPETTQWCRDMGAHHVIDHSKPLPPQVAALNLGAPPFVFCTVLVSPYMAQIAELISPQGRLGVINRENIDFTPIIAKCISIHWELMFTRILFQTADVERQHEILNEVAKLVDAGRLRTTVTENFGTISAENLRRAHTFVETGKARGKVVLEGF
jgi:zinc-binding alcohol dehydrogenase family protein